MYRARNALFLLPLSLILAATPANAARTAIDQAPDPNDPNGVIATQVFLSGYCDLQGDDCNPDSNGARLLYDFSFDGGTSFSNSVFVQGNGLLTFGAPVDFFGTSVSPSGASLNAFINDGQDPQLTDYQRTLVSGGQNNALDFGIGGGFLQSARLTVIDNVITATWFTCQSPQFCFNSPYSLALTPTADGFAGRFDFSLGRGGDDVGFVVNGVTTSTGATFLLPATIRGIDFQTAVPEPQSWAMLITGFGLTGSAIRRRRRRHQRMGVVAA